MNQPRISIISMGPGSPGLLTARARRALETIDLAVGAPRLTQGLTVPCYSPEPLISGTIEYIRSHPDKLIGVLVSGDAGFYSLSRAIVAAFGRKSVTVIPGVSVVQAAFAAIAEPWQEARFFSVHGREAVLNIPAIMASERFLVLCDGSHNPRAILERYPRLLEYFDLWSMSNLSLDNEMIVPVTRETVIPEDPLSCVVGIKKEKENHIDGEQ
ncbi:precorrin-6y C5,15-methyltransferase (decarboxylating) subunit CbiE [Geoalkalibacter subterraneus]|uniref:precorrin-6y C5,15-methyltransferase (decarboxylating) subunit CbiE n=1 Tax=Geoalkalibacter subterraneus TaxID=483547 RepID=UPI000694EB0E|nr:precorrin-6y C5,15-methyltransferase (decarboxylating) subunit CbiE [Geoalkalibacter subterraneus]